jgi:hypothetical protein
MCPSAVDDSFPGNSGARATPAHQLLEHCHSLLSMYVRRATRLSIILFVFMSEGEVANIYGNLPEKR